MSAAVASSNGTGNGLAGIKTSNKSRGQLKRLKQKAKKATGGEGASTDKGKSKGKEKPVNGVNGHSSDAMVVDGDGQQGEEEEGLEELYVAEPLLGMDGDPAAAVFADVFRHFQASSSDSNSDPNVPGGRSKGDVIYSDDEAESESGTPRPEGDDEDDFDKPLSKRKLRKAARLSVAELKRLVNKPEVVEWHDVSAQDPKLLVQLKSYRNSVPVPAHWLQKRDYLQGKRGIEKAAFQLPTFIADTGIATQRDAIKEKEKEMSLKAKTRERVQPKMGKIDIDYQKLHDAFFKYQTKPKMTMFGEIYYEGKEFETNLKEKKPGDLSQELKEALSIPPLAPPPWLIAMQRFGPPPSYPNLKIAGLNAPIPEGAQWGFHPGGWGKPPVDEYNRPLYGDVFGSAPKQNFTVQQVNREHWGELEPEEEDSDEEEEASDAAMSEDEQPSGAADGTQTPSGLETPSGFQSTTSTVPGGLETPGFMDIRKQRDREEPEPAGGRQLYQVINEREGGAVRGVLGSDRTYDLRGVPSGQMNLPVLGREEKAPRRKADGVDVAIDASQLEAGMSTEELGRRYDQSRRGARGLANDDQSDVVAEELAKRKRREEDRRKREKDFKF